MAAARPLPIEPALGPPPPPMIRRRKTEAERDADIDAALVAHEIPDYLLRPCDILPAVHCTPEELADRVNAYFTTCYMEARPPKLLELVLAVGFDSFTQMKNHARRHGEETMQTIARALTSIGIVYEDLAQKGSKFGSWMLERLPEFDPLEPKHQAPERPFETRIEANLKITGIASPETDGKQLSKHEAYLQLIKHRAFEEINQTIETHMADDGVYEVVEIPE